MNQPRFKRGFGIFVGSLLILAALLNQTRVAAFMPTTPIRAEARPFSMPVATANRLAGLHG